MLEENEEVVRVRVHLVAVPGLAGASVAPSVMRDAAVAVVAQEEHLVLPVIAVEGPAVGEDDGLAGGVAPVFIEDLGFVFGGYERHFGW